MEDSLRICIVEDNADLRQGLSYLFGASPGMEVVGLMPNCEHLIQRLRPMKPHLVLMDIDLPGANGIEGLREIKAHFPDIQVIMLTVFEDNVHILEAIMGGASGYLLKKTPPAQLVDAVWDCHRGGAPMTPSVARKVLQLFARTRSATPLPVYLTDREHEVLGLLVDGMSYKMVASRMAVSLETVRTHIKHIYEKLQVNSKSEAVAFAMRHGLG